MRILKLLFNHKPFAIYLLLFTFLGAFTGLTIVLLLIRLLII